MSEANVMKFLEEADADRLSSVDDCRRTFPDAPEAKKGSTRDANKTESTDRFKQTNAPPGKHQPGADHAYASTFVFCVPRSWSIPRKQPIRCQPQKPPPTAKTPSSYRHPDSSPGEIPVSFHYDACAGIHSKGLNPYTTGLELDPEPL